MRGVGSSRPAHAESLRPKLVNTASMRSVHLRFTLVVFAIELAVRLVLIVTHPDNYSMDAYQRWGGRHHLLVQDWLPATQSVVWLSTALGGSILAMRISMAVIGSAAVTAGAWVARALGGPAAGWLFIPVGLFGPFLTWSVVPYQEGMFLLALFSGLALALHARLTNVPQDAGLWRTADLIIGLLALVRYEGWPVVLVYVVWRLNPRAALALWGMVLWGLCKGAGVEGYASSPISYADWEGIDSRFDPAILQRTLARLWTQAIDTKAIFLIPAGLAGWNALRRAQRPGVWLAGVIFAGQIAALTGWLIGLETATYRMQALPGVLAGLFLSSGIGIWWHRTPARFPKVIVAAAALGVAVMFTAQGFDNAKRSTRSVRWEQRLVDTMNDCKECTYLVVPRTGIGTRDRHDGCEIIQGLSTHLHGESFWCMRWGDVPETFRASHAARWRKGGYVIRDARESDRNAKGKR